MSWRLVYSLWNWNLLTNIANSRTEDIMDNHNTNFVLDIGSNK
jgi:hypothetical protein